MSLIAPTQCEMCGASIPERPKGSRHGSPPKTCSVACRKARAARREKERYARVKGGQAWQATRAAYIARIKAKLDADPEFAAIFRAEAAERLRDWRARVAATDPAKHESLKAQRRAERAAWRDRMESDPAAWEAHKARCRAWYAALSPADRDRIFYAPRRKKEHNT